jgi:hypothetical protein
VLHSGPDRAPCAVPTAIRVDMVDDLMRAGENAHGARGLALARDDGFFDCPRERDFFGKELKIGIISKSFRKSVPS